jgi:hypothetical protein
VSDTGIDLCDTSIAGVSFDSQSGKYELNSQSMNDFPPGDYVIRVTGSVVDGVDLSDTIEFTLSLKNPCDDNFISINEPASVIIDDYLLFTGNEGSVFFTLPQFTLTSTKDNSELCGDIVYEVSLDGEDVSLAPQIDISTPSLDLTVLEDSFDIVGEHSIKIVAGLADYNMITTKSQTYKLNVVDSCTNPTCLSTSDDTCDQGSSEE